MDRTVRFLLGIIVASLVLLNLLLAGVRLVGTASAQGMDSLDFRALLDRLTGIERAIGSVDCK